MMDFRTESNIDSLITQGIITADNGLPAANSLLLYTLF